MRGRKLRGGGRKYGKRQESNPMDGVANLADIMLIFACGLMIAIIMFWNVDFDNLNQQESAYEDVGAVYQDPETGKIYVVQSSDSQQTEGEGTSAQTEGESGSESQSGSAQNAADS